MRAVLAILFWSVLSAAFIGPGTVTVATKAGHGFGLSLLWALTFSTVACVVLQEASARVAAVSGKDLATALRERFEGTPWRGPVVLLVAGAIGVGSAAYQAGNVLGAGAGAALVVDVDGRVFTIAVSAVASVLLWIGSTRQLATLLGAMVAVMGGAFLWTAFSLAPDPGETLAAAVTPRVPDGASWLAVGLVGTTVVPYNLFLGSGLARGWTAGRIRLGIVVAVGLGGLVSMGVLVVGTAVAGEWSYAAVAGAIEARLGDGAGRLFAIGLFAAGLSSALTAPMAAAITARGLTGRESAYRPTWIAVVATGAVCGLLGATPAPAIVFAQAMNGVLLPLVAVFLLVLMNDRRLLGEGGVNGRLANAALVVVVATTFALGGSSLWRALG
ncbi:MAG: NRAMP family divalent metal transporter [Planctomycetota bacterium JB042]